MAAQFNVELLTGRVAVVVLPAGITAVEALDLIAKLPRLCQQASLAPRTREQAEREAARARLVVPGG